MARLTRLQLRAIFAKLAKKRHGGLMTSEPWYKTVRSSKQTLASIFSGDHVRAYTDRLPLKLQQMSELQDVHVWDRFVRDAPRVGGMYSPVDGVMHISRDPGRAGVNLGYTLGLPLFAPAPHGKKSLSGSLSARVSSLRVRQIRNAKVKTRRIFYHEFAHSLERKIPADALRAWNKISRRSSEWADPTPAAKTLHPRTRSEEMFADAFSLYASSKVSRERLRRARPLSYAFMKEFFGD